MSDVTRDSLAVRAERIVVAARNGAVPPGAAAEQIIDIAQAPLREELAALRGQVEKDTRAASGLGTDILCRALYEREARPRDYLGGGDARMLFDAAEKITGLCGQVRALDEENGRVVNAARILAGDNEALTETIEGLRLATPGAMARVFHLPSCEHEKESLREELGRLSNLILAFNNKDVHDEHEIVSLREQVRALTETIELQRSDLAILANERARAEGAEYDAGLLRASLDERESDIADLTARLTERLRVFDRLTPDQQTILDRNVELCAEVASLRAQLRAAEEQVRYLRDEEANARTWCELAGQRHQEIVRLRGRVETAERERDEVLKRDANVLDIWRDRIAKLWPCDSTNYPRLDDSQTSYVRHVVLHVAKDAGKLAAGIEPRDHDRAWDGQLLGRATRNLLGNALRLCALLRLSPAELLADYCREVALAAAKAPSTPAPLPARDTKGVGDG